MSLRNLISSLFLATVLSACGGGGGGTPTSQGPASSNKPITLDEDNVTKVAESLRHEFLEPLFLFDFHRLSFSTPIPEFNYQNTVFDYACAPSGTQTITISGNGATVSSDYDQCSDSSGLTVDGGITYSFSNVDSTTRSYTFTLTYNNLVYDDGVDRTTYSGTSVLNASFALDGTATVNVVNNRSINDAALGETYISKNLTYTATFNGSVDNAVVIDYSDGNIDFLQSGYLELLWIQAENRLNFSGDGLETAYLALASDLFGLEYIDANGKSFSIAAAGDDIDNLDIFAQTNSAPNFTDLGKIYIAEASQISLDLEDWLSDVNFDVLDISASFTSSPVGANHQIVSLQAFDLVITVDTAGEYSLNIQATDPHGLSASGTILIEISTDTDGDGIPNHLDSDDDNDGVDDTSDAFPLDNTESLDTDNDGIGNNADTDDDNDGVPDVNDIKPLNPTCSSLADTVNGQCLSNIYFNKKTFN